MTRKRNTTVGRNSDRITDNTVSFRSELERRNAVSETVPADYQQGANKMAAFRRFQQIMDVILAMIIFIVVGTGLAGFFM
jgi:hypothetical protein